MIKIINMIEKLNYVYASDRFFIRNLEKNENAPDGLGAFSRSGHPRLLPI